MSSAVRSVFSLLFIVSFQVVEQATHVLGHVPYSFVMWYSGCLCSAFSEERGNRRVSLMGPPRGYADLGCELASAICMHDCRHSYDFARYSPRNR